MNKEMKPVPFARYERFVEKMKKHCEEFIEISKKTVGEGTTIHDYFNEVAKLESKMITAVKGEHKWKERMKKPKTIRKRKKK